MNRIAISSSLLLLCLILSNCSNSIEIERANDPWVVRTNLDGRPEMIGVALHKDMYAAYDANLGALYKVWKGDIHFTGPVYDNLHGPQPETRGEAYISEELENSPWIIVSNGNRQSITPTYEGYLLQDNQLTLKYTLLLPSDDKISIEETSDYTFIKKTGRPGFRRNFKTAGVPEGKSVLLKTSFEHLEKEADLTTDGELMENTFTTRNFDWGSSLKSKGILKLNPNGTTYLQSFFSSKSTDHINTDKSHYDSQEKSMDDHQSASETVDPEDLEALAEVGKSIIGKNDCAACHQMDKKIIGPSYTMVAQKYETTIATVDLLSSKIMNGGSGVWGEQPMAPHPNVSEADAKAMATYILSVLPDDASDRKAGVAVDFYEIGQPLASLPEVVAGQNPNVSEVYPNIDFRSGNPDIGKDTDENFSGFTTDFVMEVNGYLNVPETKTYDLQFIANNGGKLSIDGKVVSQGSFYEGTFEDDFEIELTEGTHKINIEFYHHLFDKYLVLLWRDNKNKEYEPIPASAYTHDPFDIKPTSPGIKSLVSNKAPGFGASLKSVHPSYDLSEVRPPGFEPRVGDLEFRKDGRLVLCTWDGQVYEMDNVTGSNPDNIKVTKIADGLCEPLGITEVDGEVYVLQRWELTKLVDHNGDRNTDEYVHIASFGSKASFHEWSFGLIYKDGYFYCTTGIAMGRGSEDMHVDRGKALKIGMDGSYSHVAYGLKEPNGIGIGVDDEIFVADNEGEYQPVCQIFHIPTEGKPFYGNKSVEADHLPEDIEISPPVIWLPQNEIGNSPSQPILMLDGPYKGQMMHGEITHGGIKRDFIEKVKGQYQGAVFRFVQGLEVGINRIEYGPDGALYASGLGGAQDFGHKGHQFGLQRLKYNGNPAFEMLAIRAKSNGLEMEFTKPLRIGDGTDPGDYKIQQWYYTWTHEGESQQKRNLENLEVRSVTLSSDRKKAFLEINGMKKRHVLYVELQPTFLSENNEQLWSNQSWYTLNEFPDEAGKVRPYPHPSVANTLSPPEVQDGWELLFDGKSLKGWENNLTMSWKAGDGYLLGQGKSALLATDQSFDNFELELEWKVEPSAEGGILFHVADASNREKALSDSPRMQLTDDQTEAAKMVHTHKSGAIYDMLKPTFAVTKPINEYNHTRLVVNGIRVEHWINGILVLQYQIGSEEWNKGLEASSFANNENYGKANAGHIALYSDKGKMWVRNIRIKKSGNGI